MDDTHTHSLTCATLLAAVVKFTDVIDKVGELFSAFAHRRGGTIKVAVSLITAESHLG